MDEPSPAMRQADLYSRPGWRQAPRRSQGRLAGPLAQGRWLTLLLLLGVLLSVIWSVEAADWVPGLPSLTLTCLVAVAVAFVLVLLPLPAALLHAIGLPVVAGAILLQTLALAEGRGLGERWDNLYSRGSLWWQAVRSGDFNSDTLPFMLLVVSLTWLLAYVATWSALRYASFWLAVLPAAIASIVNLSYLPPRFDWFFAMYLVFSLLLAGRLNALRRLRQWDRAGVKYPSGATGSNLANALWLATIALIVAWILPYSGTMSLVKSGIDNISGPWERAQQHANRLFTSVTVRKGGPLRSFSGTLPFRAPAEAGDTTVLTITSDYPYYWRATIYDIYAGQGWKSSGRMEKPLGWEPPGMPVSQYAYRYRIIQHVELGLQTEVMVAAGQPAEADVSAEIDIARREPQTIPLTGQAQGLPPDLANVANNIKRFLGGPRPLSREEIFSLLPADLQGEKVTTSGLTVSSIEVTRKEPNPADIITLRSQSKMGKGSSYSVASTISAAPAKALAQSPANYPGWVRELYLQLPSELPARVGRLAQELTAGKGNTYERAMAIHDYLRAIPYDRATSPPSFDRDGVDWFLFDAKKGYADYYASAMVVMLRSIGIPARLAAGYYTGAFDQEKGAYVVKTYDVHTWPEVFFPGFGWVEFNPNPKYPPLERPQIDETGEAVELPEDLFSAPLEELYPPFEDPFGLQEGAQETTGEGPGAWWLWLLVVAAAVGALVLAGRFVWSRSLAGMPYPVRVYEEMCRLAGLAGMGPRQQQTPQEYSDSLSTLLPDNRRDISEIASGYSGARFGRSKPTPEEERGLREAWQALRSRIIMRILPWRR